MAILQQTYDMMARINAFQSEGTSLEALALEVLGPKIASSPPERCFDTIEKALVQLDRFSGLAKRPVDYAELDKQSGLSR
jgi:hypothetical protein